MLLGKEAESEAIVGVKPGIRIPSKSIRQDWFPRGPGAIPAPIENQANEEAYPGENGFDSRSINCYPFSTPQESKKGRPQ